jgi:hypothetical protein
VDWSHLAQELPSKARFEGEIEEMVESRGRRGGWCQQLLDDLNKIKDSGM